MTSSKLIAFSLCLGASGWALAAEPLLTPQALSPLLQQPGVRVIDIRDPKAFAAQHIPGAVNAPYGQWRGPATNPGELPDHDKLVALVQKLGLTATTHAWWSPPARTPPTSAPWPACTGRSSPWG
jgi:thiosulfate/3-mercaptopyruvate sulfurtransferase